MNVQPDWDKAPEWANFYAVDMDGVGYWYERQPYLDMAVDPGYYRVADGRVQRALICTTPFVCERPKNKQYIPLRLKGSGLWQVCVLENRVWRAIGPEVFKSKKLAQDWLKENIK